MSPKHSPISPNGFRFGTIDSPKSPGFYLKERFAEKDSLYLDMGRPELNGKIDTINTASQNNSVLLKKGSNASVGSGTNPDSFSAFANQHANNEKRGKGFKLHSGSHGGQSVLKAALLRNMQKNNNDLAGEESKEDGVSSPNNQSLSDRFSHRLLAFNDRQSSGSQDNDSEDDGYSQSPKHYKLPESTPKEKTSFTKRRFQPFAQKADTKSK